MKYWLIATLALLIAAPASAQDPKAGAPDMTKMGPWSRKPTDEKKTKKEVAAFFKAQDDFGKKGDFEAGLAAVDFPVFMVTDDAKGVPEAALWSKEQYSAMMKPMWETMPKDTKTTHKLNVMVLSDSLVNVTDEFTMTTGKQKMTGRNLSLLIKRDGVWKWKAMAEAGWGGMSAPPPPPSEVKPAPETKPAAKPEPPKR